MIKLLTVLLCSLSFFNARSQLTKGNWLVGGSGTLYSYNDQISSLSQSYETNYTSVDASASVGFFLFDKFSAGLRPYFSSIKGKSLAGGSLNNHRLAVGPFAKYYFLDKEKPYNILADLGYQFGFNRNLGDVKNGKFRMLSAMAGTEIFFNSSAGIEILVGYSQRLISQYYSADFQSTNKKGFQFSIGFQLHLEKEQK